MGGSHIQLFLTKSKQIFYMKVMGSFVLNSSHCLMRPQVFSVASCVLGFIQVFSVASCVLGFIQVFSVASCVLGFIQVFSVASCVLGFIQMFKGRFHGTCCKMTIMSNLFHIRIESCIIKKLHVFKIQLIHLLVSAYLYFEFIIKFPQINAFYFFTLLRLFCNHSCGITPKLCS